MLSPDLCEQKFLPCSYMLPAMELRNWKTLYLYFNFSLLLSHFIRFFPGDFTVK